MKKSAITTTFLPVVRRWACAAYYRDHRDAPDEPLADVLRRIDAAAPGPRADFLLGRGEAVLHPDLPDILKALRLRGASKITLETDGFLLARESRVLFLRDAGVTDIRVNLHSCHASGYAVVTGIDGLLPHVAAALRHIRHAGLRLVLNIPLLSPAVSAPDAFVEMLAEAMPGHDGVDLVFGFPLGSRAYCAYKGIEPRPFSAYRQAFVRACAQAARLGMVCRIAERGGIPFCFLGTEAPAVLAAFAFNPFGTGSDTPDGCKAEACHTCHYFRPCRGIHKAYATAFGDRELAPIAGRLAGLSGDRTRSPARPWTDDARQHGRRSRLKVMRLCTRCNQECVFCPTDDTSANIVLEEKQQLKMLYRWSRLGVEYVSFSGGEPTLCPSLPRLLRYARHLQVPEREVVTNGVRLADPAYANELVSSGLSRAFVSLHAHRADLSDGLTQRPGDFQRTLQGMQNLVPERLCLTANHVICAANVTALPEFVRFIHATFGQRVMISFAFITPLYRAYERRGELVPRISDVMPHLHAALSLAATLGVSCKVPVRPGIPPCFLAADYRYLSDIQFLTDQILSEDVLRKQKAAACRHCRYDDTCAGLWNTYCELHGTEELVPIQHE